MYLLLHVLLLLFIYLISFFCRLHSTSIQNTYRWLVLIIINTLSLPYLLLQATDGATDKALSTHFLNKTLIYPTCIFILRCSLDLIDINNMSDYDRVKSGGLKFKGASSKYGQPFNFVHNACWLRLKLTIWATSDHLSIYQIQAILTRRLKFSHIQWINIDPINNINSYQFSSCPHSFSLLHISPSWRAFVLVVCHAS